MEEGSCERGSNDRGQKKSTASSGRVSAVRIKSSSCVSDCNCDRINKICARNEKRKLIIEFGTGSKLHEIAEAEAAAAATVAATATAAREVPCGSM